MATQPQQSDHVTKVCDLATLLLDAITRANGLQDDWNYLDLSNQLTEANCNGRTPAEIAAFYTTLSALNGLMAAGHGTNLAKLRRYTS